MIETDLPGRLRSFAEAAGPFGVFVMLGLLLVLVLSVVMCKRNFLIFLYLACLMFSGFAVEAVASGSVLLRWLLIFLIAATAIYGVRSPGLPALMLAGYAAVGLLSAPVSPLLFWTIQRASLMLVITIPMAAAVAHHISTMDDITKLIKVYLIAAGLYVLLGLVSLPSLRAGARFAGAGVSAPLFVLTGGLLLPIALWGAMSEVGKRWRWYCVSLVVIIGLLMIISGQRTGTFAGIIGTLPILARFGLRKLFLGIVLVSLGLIVVIAVLSLMPEQAQFVQERFFSIETTGRLQRWATALKLCLENPFLGHGAGAHGAVGFGFHNAFLVVWYNGGLIGLICFGGAFLVMAFQAFRLIVQRQSEEIRDLGRLLLGLSLASIAAAFFESKLVSPSNIAICVAVTISVILARLKGILQQYWLEPAIEEGLPADISYADDGYRSYSL